MDFLLKVGLILLVVYLNIEDIYKKEVPNFGNILFFFLSIYYMSLQGVVVSRIFLSVAVYIFPLILLYGYVSDFLEKDVLGFGDIKFIMGVGALMSSELLWISLYYFYLFSFSLSAVFGLLYIHIKQEREIPMLPAFSISFILLKVFL